MYSKCKDVSDILSEKRSNYKNIYKDVHRQAMANVKNFEKSLEKSWRNVNYHKTGGTFTS